MEDIKRDVVNVLTGDDLGCGDESDLTPETCERLWLEGLKIESPKELDINEIVSVLNRYAWRDQEDWIVNDEEKQDSVVSQTFLKALNEDQACDIWTLHIEDARAIASYLLLTRPEKGRDVEVA